MQRMVSMAMRFSPSVVAAVGENSQPTPDAKCFSRVISSPPVTLSGSDRQTVKGTSRETVFGCGSAA